MHSRRAPALLALALLAGQDALAFTTTITAGSPRAIYLQVGVGTANGNNSTVNLVSVTVPAAQVGNSSAQAMATNTGATSSFYDGYAFCNANTLYIGGFYRYNNNNAGTGATLTALSPANLTATGGYTIPFTQISWTSGGNGDTGAEPFPAGTFVGGTQTIGTIARNQWAESCHTFSYANGAVRSAGTYTGRVTYTLTAP